MTTIKIKGMSCNHCVTTITKVLNNIKGIKNVKVRLEKGEATFDEEKPVDVNMVKEQIRNAGYEVG
ncbi:MAG TPA: heavy-metal-associated domain-containing protein [Proteobacteria bacterium]|nr:heavy-metal-associated domain-containing protein [Pseudomonadota bacterium]